eukprot:6464052-Amphidinium_carterae.1
MCKVYKQKWKATLRFRRESMHKKCTECAKLEQQRKQHTGPDAERVRKAHTRHMEEVYRDRAADLRLMVLSEKAVTVMSPGDPNSIVSVVIDGMDLAKFALPRAQDFMAAKAHSNLHRPRAKLTGCIMDGLVESYYLCAPDICGTASREVTLLAMLLDKGANVLEQQGRQMPTSLRIHSDNASAETKNFVCFAFGAYLVANSVFKTVDYTQDRVGHSHGRGDQRFSTIWSAIKRERTV